MVRKIVVWRLRCWITSEVCYHIPYIKVIVCARPVALAQYEHPQAESRPVHSPWLTVEYKDRASPKMYGLICRQSREDDTASGKAMKHARLKRSKLDHSRESNYLRASLCYFLILAQSYNKSSECQKEAGWERWWEDTGDALIQCDQSLNHWVTDCQT